MNPNTIEDLTTFAEGVQYASNWREAMAQLAIIIRDEFVAQAPAVPPEQQPA